MSAELVPMPDEPSLVHWQSEWERVVVQLSQFNDVIWLNYDVWYLLGEGGREFFMNQGCLLKMRPMEFFRDNDNPQRVALANRYDLQRLIPGFIEVYEGDGLSRFFPDRPVQEYTGNPVGHQVTGPTDENIFASLPPCHDASVSGDYGEHFMQQSMPVNRSFGEPSGNMQMNYFSATAAQNSMVGAGQNTQFQPQLQVMPPVAAQVPSPPLEFKTSVDELIAEYAPCSKTTRHSPGPKRNAPRGRNLSGQSQED
ncbi:hypothetical protein F5Y07DRAFT_413330 [Xylaria sp. FL0933]|nr:hypothetical protein F5Y07DRAFT_413330 [Xylaria sp. FL0933]